MEEPTYNFSPSQPAICIAKGEGGDGVYLQHGAHWYYDGRNAACQISCQPELNPSEFVRYGRQILRYRFGAGLGW